MTDRLEPIRQMLITPLIEELDVVQPSLRKAEARRFVELVEEHFGKDLYNKQVRAQFKALVSQIGERWADEAGTDG